MIAKELISDDVPEISPNDNGQKASTLMDEFRMTHLPVINGQNQLVGMLSETALFDVDDWDAPVESYKSTLVDISVKENDHIFTVIKQMGENNSSCIAVVSEKQQFIGSISIYHLMKIISQLALFQDHGGILELEMNIIDYSLSEIANIVESNNAKILGMYIRNHPDSRKIHVALKINKSDLSAVVQTFERYEYTIAARFYQNNENDDLQNRYDNLMNYLNI